MKKRHRTIVRQTGIYVESHFLRVAVSPSYRQLTPDANAVIALWVFEETARRKDSTSTAIYARGWVCRY
jgi:hypothetical protein